MKPTILEAIHHLSEHYGMSLDEAARLVRTPLHPAGLRDELAGRAMQGICADLNTWGTTLEQIGTQAYMVADSMLEARIK